MEKEQIDSIEKLEQLLQHQPALIQKLTEAVETGRFFITISFQKKLKPEDEHDLQHFYLRVGYERIDALNTLRHLQADFTAKEMPTAELPDQEKWH